MKTAHSVKFDLIIDNAFILDGTGQKGYEGCIAVKNQRIEKIGAMSTGIAKNIIDARGFCVAPGIIDIHTHADRAILKHPEALNLVKQGITSVIGGNCGSGPKNAGAFLQSVEQTPPAINIGLLSGHNTIRRMVTGNKNRTPGKSEMEKMKSILQNDLVNGSFGISTGLKYLPGVFAKTDEIIELAKITAENNGIYTTHLRDEGMKIFEALEETFTIARASGVPVQISHHKLIGSKMWGQSTATLEAITKAYNSGIDIAVDQYPYTASSTGIDILFPAWALEGAKEQIRGRLADSGNVERIREGIRYNILYDRGGADLNNILMTHFPENPAYEGKTIAEILSYEKMPVTLDKGIELIISLFKTGINSAATAVYFCIDEGDVKNIMKHPLTIHASDSAVRLYGSGNPHPRNYGTFPRVLRKYVREEKLLTLENAIHKMTGKPAQRFSIKDRGLLQEGLYADIVIFDPQNIADRATFRSPHQYPAGIEKVIVNGTPVIDNETFTGRYPGKPLRKT